MTEATPIFDRMSAAIWPCGVIGHTRQRWEDERSGILYCPDCGTEIWVGDDA